MPKYFSRQSSLVLKRKNVTIISHKVAVGGERYSKDAYYVVFAYSIDENLDRGYIPEKIRRAPHRILSAKIQAFRNVSTTSTQCRGRILQNFRGGIFGFYDIFKKCHTRVEWNYCFWLIRRILLISCDSNSSMSGDPDTLTLPLLRKGDAEKPKIPKLRVIHFLRRKKYSGWSANRVPPFIWKFQTRLSAHCVVSRENEPKQEFRRHFFLSERTKLT